MFFIYVDESGSSGFDPVQHFFVLSAIVVKADQCIPIQEKLKKLKQEFSLGDIEIKGRDIEQAKNIFKHISAETRRGLVHRLFELLFAHAISLYSVVFSKEEKSIRRLSMSAEDIYHYTYKRLIDRIEDFLESKNEDGILLIDSRASSIRSHLKDDRLIRFHQGYLSQLAKEEKQNRIVEYPLFVQSEFFAGAQLADLCAYHIFRALQIRFGRQFLEASEVEKSAFMPEIDETMFYSDEFLDSLFSHPDVDLPLLAKIIKRTGRIDKLP